MKPDANKLHFFLGANTPQGFVSRFDQLADVENGWHMMVIKGAPGNGKSTMMKKLADKFEKEFENIEMIHCSSDVDSIDGVIVPGLRLAIVDGTPPHTIEPKYPGAFESLVDMTVCWDDSKLFASRDKIIALYKSISRSHEHSCRFLAAAGSLVGDTYRITLECINTAKLSAYCTRLAEKELKPSKKGPGREKVRFLTAVTNKGATCFIDTAKLLAKRIYLINDDHGAVSRLLLYSIRSKALAAGYDVISCYCSLSPFDKLEQLFIPEIQLGFMTSNSFHDFGNDIDPYRIINSQRFSDLEKLKASKRRILFNRKAAAQMIKQTEALMRDAKNLHDELEGYYIQATDFSKVDQLTEQIIMKAESYRSDIS